MKVLVYTDAQATDGHERCFTDPTRPLQLWRIERMYAELRRIYEENHCDALWDLGDTTDDRSAIPVPVIDLLCDCLEPFDGSMNIKLVGNHEQWLRSTSVHVGKMFRRFFDVVESTKIIRCGDVNIICLSYHDDPGVMVEFLRRCPRNVPTILLGHFQVAGCQMASGLAATGVPAKEMEFVNIALLGHIHRPQTIADKLHYVGSPFQQHWGEAGENKRVAILEVGGPKGAELTWVPLNGFPRYLQVSYDQFVEAVKQDSEDRYKVVLRSVEETEKFYAHPLANRVDEAIYDYATEATPVDEASEVIPRTKQDVLREYVRRFPPGQWGVILDEAAMLEYGEQIVRP